MKHKLAESSEEIADPHNFVLDIWTGERPNVVAWYRRIQARPSYKAEVSDWMKPEELPEMHNAGTRNKARIAEFRTHYLENDFGAKVY